MADLTAEQIITVRVNGKVSDLCEYFVYDASGEKVGLKMGNHPFGYSDYIDIKIDVATGQIVGWDSDEIRKTIIAQVNGE